MFTCGRGQHGQLGLGSYGDESSPSYVAKVPDKVSDMACGCVHTLVVTTQGEVYVMGDNSYGQLGTGPPSKGSSLPILLEELTVAKIT